VAPSGRVGRVASTALLVLVAAGATTAVMLAHLESVPAGSAMRVDGALVSEAQLAQRVKVLSTLYGIAAPGDPAGLDRFRRDTAKTIAVSDVLDAVASKKGIVIADKTANDQLSNMVDKSFPQGREAFDQQLSAAGISQQDVLDEIKRQLADAELFKQITAGVANPTDQDIAQIYQQRKPEMQVPEKRHVRNIVIATADQANHVKAQLAGGADFATVADQSSEDDSTKTKGGDLGEVIRDQLEKPYGDAAFGAAPNTVFGPVQTHYGWNVGQVLEVTPSLPLSLDQVRGQLRANMLAHRKQDAWTVWLSGELKSAHVSYAGAYLPTDPESAAPPPIPAN
jgi:peptidyl-prolyl cis-trans isomerase C